jgi:hypothetical protein
MTGQHSTDRLFLPLRGIRSPDSGSEEEIMQAFRTTRDELRRLVQELLEGL